MGNGIIDLSPTKLREGLVFKQFFGGEHWKAVSNKYLLEYGKAKKV
jgi:hypothetical protein